MKVSISELFTTATNVHHLRHPNQAEGKEKTSIGQRILGVGLFALSGLLSLGIAPIFYLIKAYQKISINPDSPSAKKADAISQVVFDMEAVAKIKKAEPLFAAIEQGDLPALQQLLSSGNQNVNSYDKDGIPLLLTAIAHKQKDILAFLLKQPNLDINISKFWNGGNIGWTALHEAVESRNLEIVQMLLQTEISRDIQISPKYLHGEGYTAFLLAVVYKKFEIIQAFLEDPKGQPSFEAKDAYGNNLFHLLFKGNSTIINGNDGAKLLHLLIEKCPKEVQEKLFLKRNQHGMTPYELSQEALQGRIDDIKRHNMESLLPEYETMKELCKLLKSPIT